MRIITWNVNGLRACINKGGLKAVEALNPDIICLQEIKTMEPFKALDGYWHFYNTGTRKGYSGTLILTKMEPVSFAYGFPWDEGDEEGRIITMEFEDFYLLNCYVPNSKFALNRERIRKSWDRKLRRAVRELNKKKPLIICGDFNVARSRIEIYKEHNLYKAQHEAFKSQESADLEKLLDLGLTDVFRHLYPDARDVYSWWSLRRNKRIENRGWRIDYFFVSNVLNEDVIDVTHHSEIMGSDHCPVELEISPNFKFMELRAEWNSIDWEAAEDELYAYQKEIALAAADKDWRAIAALQEGILDSYYCKCLAVREAAKSGARAGVDKVYWRNPEDKMRAAHELEYRSFEAQAIKEVRITSHNKKRTVGIMNFFDHAMHILASYCLKPYIESTTDAHTYAFRMDRSVFDAHAMFLDILEENTRLNYIMYVDIKHFYENIDHKWLLDHVPLDEKLLEGILKIDTVKGKELILNNGKGIPLGSNLAPFLASIYLDGLEELIYKELYGTANPERKDHGDYLRFADDIIIAVEDIQTGTRLLMLIKYFLKERMLEINTEKSGIFSLADGFDFMSWHYRKCGDNIVVTPTIEAKERFLEDCWEIIDNKRISQSDMIKKLNRKLTGWGFHHRNCNASQVFAEVDERIRGYLLESLEKRLPQKTFNQLQEDYWFSDGIGLYYCLPDNKSVYLQHLSDMPLIQRTLHMKKEDLNAFLDSEYLEDFKKEEEIRNVIGDYRPVWKRNNGRCYYCGRKILPDQRREITTIQKDGLDRLTYIHSDCRGHGFYERQMLQDLNGLPEASILSAIKRTKVKDIFERKHWYDLDSNEVEVVDPKTFSKQQRSKGQWYNRRVKKRGKEERYAYRKFINESNESQLSGLEELAELHLKPNDVKEVLFELPMDLDLENVGPNFVEEAEQFFRLIIKEYGLKK